MSKEIIKVRYDDETRWLTAEKKVIEALQGNDELEIIYEEHGEQHFCLLTDIAGDEVTIKGKTIVIPD